MARLKLNFVQTHRKIFRAILWATLLFSFVSAGLSTFGISDALAKFQNPFFLAALLLIITMLNPVEEIHEDVKFLRNTERTSAPSRTYALQQELWGELDRAVKEAESTLDLTHIRDQPPHDFGEEARHYSETVLEWIKKKPDRSVRRIICVNSPTMREWAQYLNKVQKRTPRYHVRVLDWSISAPALNMAIIDEKAVFLALTGDTFERTRGFAVEDKTTAEYFGHYYANLWAASVDLDEFLIRQNAG